MGLGIGRRRFSGHRYGDAASDCEESILENLSDGRLLRSGHALLRGELHDSASQPAAEISRQYFLRDLRSRAHGLPADGWAKEDEGRSGKLHGEGGCAVTFTSSIDSFSCPRAARSQAG